MTKAPLAIALQLAEELQFHPTDYKVSLKGIVNVIDFAAFAPGMRPLCAYLLLTDGRGEGELRLEVLELKPSAEAIRIYRTSSWMTFPPDPLLVVHKVIQLKNIHFRSPGEHLFVVTFDGQSVADRRVLVR